MQHLVPALSGSLTGDSSDPQRAITARRMCDFTRVHYRCLRLQRHRRRRRLHGVITLRSSQLTL